MGIEVVTLKKDGRSKKVLRHECYCRAHGLDYEEGVRCLPIHPHADFGGSQINLAEVIEETMLLPLTIENRTLKDALAVTAALLSTDGLG